MVKQAWFPLQWITFWCKNYHECIKDANKLYEKLSVSYDMQYNWASCSHYESNDFSVLSIVCCNSILLIESAAYDVELASETMQKATKGVAATRFFVVNNFAKMSYV